MLKYMGIEGAKLLTDIFNEAWNKECVPNDWEISVLLPIHKKGDTKNCNNYRGIALLSTALKVYERILEQKLKKYIEPTLSEAQSGFRKGRSVQDHIFSVKQIIEKTLTSKSTAYLAFIDLQKAFDRVQRQKIWDSLKMRGVHKKLVEAIKSLYYKNRNYVRYKNMISTEFETLEGLRQGGVLSPVLFTVFMDDIIKECTPYLKKLNVGYRKLQTITISECAFADDVVVLAEKEKDLENNLQKWNEVLTKYGMKINTQKTKVMVIAKEQHNINIQINDEVIEQVNQFQYLGVIIQANGKQEMDINERISKTTNIFHAIKNTFISKREITTKTKITVFNTIYRPVLTYGCESWVLSRALKSKIQALEMKYLRRVKGVTLRDRIRNTVIREKLKTTSILEYIEQRQLSWWGHMIRMNDSIPVKNVWEAKVQHKRDRGRPKEDWNSVVTKIILNKGKTVPEAKREAKDKKKWSKFVHNK